MPRVPERARRLCPRFSSSSDHQERTTALVTRSSNRKLSGRSGPTPTNIGSLASPPSPPQLFRRRRPRLIWRRCLHPTLALSSLAVLLHRGRRRSAERTMFVPLAHSRSGLVGRQPFAYRNRCGQPLGRARLDVSLAREEPALPPGRPLQTAMILLPRPPPSVRRISGRSARHGVWRRSRRPVSSDRVLTGRVSRRIYGIEHDLDELSCTRRPRGSTRHWRATCPTGSPLGAVTATVFSDLESVRVHG